MDLQCIEAFGGLPKVRPTLLTRRCLCWMRIDQRVPRPGLGDGRPRAPAALGDARPATTSSDSASPSHCGIGTLDGRRDFLRRRAVTPRVCLCTFPSTCLASRRAPRF